MGEVEENGAQGCGGGLAAQLRDKGDAVHGLRGGRELGVAGHLEDGGEKVLAHHGGGADAARAGGAGPADDERHADAALVADALAAAQGEVGERVAQAAALRARQTAETGRVVREWLLPQEVLLPVGCGEAYFLGNAGNGACVEQGE